MKHSSFSLKHADKVIVSSILPRSDDTVQHKVDEVNNATSELCFTDPNIEYISNDGSFRLADQTQNETFFVNDGLHPSYHGTTRLLKNLGLAELASVKRWARNDSGRNQPPPQWYRINLTLLKIIHGWEE